MYPHERLLDGLVTKAIKTWDIFSPGDKVVIGLSGGKDSAVLAYLLASMVKHHRLPVTLHALYIHTDFSEHRLAPTLKTLVQSWGIEVTELDVPVRARLQEGRKLNCYWCSMQRRTELIRFAEKHGYNTIALGHHLDDVLETVLMNMLGKGELATMLPVMQYEKYPIKIARPLYLVEEHQIVLFAQELGLYENGGMTICTCTFNIDGRRDTTGKLLESLTGGSSKKKHLLLQSLMNVKHDYLPKV